LCRYVSGTVMFKIGREDPVASMDTSGKIIWSKHNDVQTVNVKSLPSEYEIQVGAVQVESSGSISLKPPAFNP
jgi:coatomer subunit beta'